MGINASVKELYRDCGCARAGRGDDRLYERGAPASAFKARGRCKQPGVLAYAIVNVHSCLQKLLQPARDL